MTGKERILCTLDRCEPDAVPTFEWFIDARVGLALVDSDDPVDIAERLDLDGVNLRPDYGREFVSEDTFRDEWGTIRRLTGDCLPAVIEAPIQEITAHGDYAFPDPAAADRFRTVERALQQFGDVRAVVLNLRDGFSDMRDLLGYEQCLMGLLAEQDAYRELLARCVEYNLALARTAVDRYGIEVVATTDDVASARGPLMSPNVYFDVIGPAFQTVIQGYKELGLRCIKHCDGDVRPFAEFWLEAGVDCLDPIDPGAGLTLRDMKAKHGDRVCLKGNVDCTGALCTGTADDVEAEVEACLRDGASGGGYILSSSNTIHRGVKPENYRSMLDALRRHGTYPMEV